MSAVLKVVEKEGMDNKNKALDAALAQIERAFGKGSIMKLGQREAVRRVEQHQRVRHRERPRLVVAAAGDRTMPRQRNEPFG